MHTYLRILRLVRPYLPQVILSMLCMVVFSLLSVFGIVMLGPFLRALFSTEPGALEAAREAAVAAETAGVWDGIRQGDTEGLRNALMAPLYDWLLQGSRMEALWRIVVAFFFATLGKNAFGYLQMILTDWVQHSFVRDLRNRLFAKFTELPLAFFHGQRTGELMSRATNDVLVVNRCVNVSFTNTARDPILIFAYLGVALALSWKLTLVAMIVLPASLGVIVAVGKVLRRYSRRQQERMADLTARLQETISGIRVVKAFNGEERENARFRVESQRLFHELFKIARMQRLSSPLTEQLSVAVGLFILWYGGRQVLTDQTLAPDMFLMFLFVIFSMGKPIKALSQVNNAIQEGMAAAERIFDILDRPVEVEDRPDAADAGDVKGAIVFRGVRFRYEDGEEVLKGIDLDIAPGEVVALVGPSGGGKSTLVDLVPRFHDPSAGSVELDGRDLRDLTLDSVRGAMGIVTQEVILFNDTVRANIAYGRPEARDEEIVAAAKAANAHEFILQMPNGYDTRIGDRGVKLSGGQRQRLSIARAVLRNPPVLILDEATSALDTESEQLVQQAIDRLVKDRTTIVIAHRLSTIQNVDRICVLEKGSVVQQGSHQELLTEGGLYGRLHELQFRS